MPPPGPNDGSKRMSRSVKLAFMGVGGAALLYSCGPAIGGLTALPFILGMSNPFYRQPQNCGPAVPGSPACEPNQASSSSGSSGSGYRGSSSSSTTGSSSSAQSTSSRGGFGSTASSHGSSGSS